MRLSTIKPTGTFLSRSAINSVKVTFAPEKSARIQTLKKFRTMISPIRTISPKTANPAIFTISMAWYGWRLLRGQRRFDRLDHFLGVRLGSRFEPLQHLSIFADQKFPKVPFNLAGKLRVFAGQAGIQRMLLRSFHMSLLHQRKAHIVSLAAELDDLVA